MFKKYQHIHFVGIGGIGMSGIAQVLLTLKYHVSGSDLKRSSVTRELSRRGAKIMIGHKEENVRSAHVVVVSSAVKENNPEVVSARRNGIPVVPRAEMLSELMRLKYGIAIAGTHGKTTTTSLIATILTSAGMDPTMIIGGKVNSFRTNARLGRGEFLVAEADESDRSFLKLTPTIAVITNIDQEHMENYKDFEHVKETYVSFANKVPFYGAIIACSDHDEVKNLLPLIKRRVITYGLSNADFTASNMSQNGEMIVFDVFHKDVKLGNIKLRLPGRHNVLNALAATAVALELDVPFAKIKKGFLAFRGIERRFQILLNKKDDSMVVTDYAHHPREIEAVFSAVREGWPKRRLICVLQPHRYTRLSALFDEFVKVLAKADEVIVLPTYAAGEAPTEGVSASLLAERVAFLNGGRAVYIKEGQDVTDFVKKMAQPDDIILFLGAGDIWKVAKKVANSMSS